MSKKKKKFKKLIQANTNKRAYSIKQDKIQAT